MTLSLQSICSALYYTYFFTSSFFFVTIAALVCLVTAPFDKNRRLLHYYASLWGCHYAHVSPWWKLTYNGCNKVDPHKTYIYVANHQSLIDIMVIYGIFKPFKWVAKASIAKIPFIGQNMYLNQYIFLERGDLSSIKKMMKDCKKWLNQGASLMIFPEGTRSPDGKLLAFRDGAFKLACQLKLPIVPIVQCGTGAILPKGSFNLNFTGQIIVEMLDPVDPADFNYEFRPLTNHVFKLMEETLANLEKQRKVKNLKENNSTHSSIEI